MNPLSPKSLLLFLSLGLNPGFANSAADHPELSAADEAYSAERYQEAANLYRKDAELGVTAAQVNLALMYLDGTGVPQDHGEAAAWFRRAADQGNSEAQYNLGLLYQEGKGVSQNRVEAAKWFILCGAEQNSAAIEKLLTPEQFADAKKAATAWLAERDKH
jgi:uncharacterized protein